MADDFTDILGGEEPLRLADNRPSLDRLSPEAVFAEEYVRTGSAMMAVNRSGLTDPRYPVEIVARELLKRPDIQSMISLAGKGAGVSRREVTEYTRELILDELQMVHERSISTGNMASAISAVKTQAQLLGFLDQTINVNHTLSAKGMSLADLRAAVSARMPGDDAVIIDGVSRDVSGD